MREPDGARKACGAPGCSAPWAVTVEPIAAAEVETMNSLRLILVVIGRPPGFVRLGSGVTSYHPGKEPPRTQRTPRSRMLGTAKLARILQKQDTLTLGLTSALVLSRKPQLCSLLGVLCVLGGSIRQLDRFANSASESVRLSGRCFFEAMRRSGRAGAERLDVLNTGGDLKVLCHLSYGFFYDLL
jgi:hypothetical protein